MTTTTLTDTTSTTTTPVVTSTTNSTTSTGYDYNSMFAPSMANDYFGSQIFGNNSIYTQQNNSNQTMQAVQTTQSPSSEQELADALAQIYGTPTTLGSALLREQMIESAKNELGYLNTTTNVAPNTTVSTTPVQTNNQTQQTVANIGTPTMQDYMIGSQIANSFANDIPLTSTQTSYTSNDFFANQAFGNNNVQNIQMNTNNTGLSYSA